MLPSCAWAIGQSMASPSPEPRSTDKSYQLSLARKRSPMMHYQCQKIDVARDFSAKDYRKRASLY
ncbi:hypothetical protein [Altericista sp. CCNU0014]|uniref:hypothetical protein n=1 Tax=Altericista sp. CCNU0014 TaxID=3082949 RepID=UPI00384DEA04